MGTLLDRARRRAPAMLTAAALAGTMITGVAGPAAAAPAVAVPGVFGWGFNDYGEVGNGTFAPQPSPVAVTLPASVVQIAEGIDDSAAVLANGTLATWGADFYGQIGDGQGPDQRPAPFVVPGLTGITQVAIGGSHMLALDSGGTVWSWGDNSSGQLGNGATSSIEGSDPTPVPVPGLTGITQIAAGDRHSLALRSDGTVWAWGDNSYGQLGDGTTAAEDRPERVPGLTGITRITAGDDISYAIRAGGTVLAWGDNSTGLLGNGTAAGISPVPVAVPGLTGVTSISSSLDGSGTLALVGSSGTMWSWGNDTYGENGDGTTTPRYTPAATSLTGVTRVSAGMGSSAAVLASGKLLTWGDDTLDELGRSGVNATIPEPVTTLAGVTQVALGNVSGLAVGSPAPRVPSVVGDVQAVASQILQAAGYALGRVTIVVDLNCASIGKVITQSPAAGTIAQPGTAVSVEIGKAGGKCL
jgi:alpha-tubulin suppressor-like RCC1 family protein